jgi:hypothetical protein
MRITRERETERNARGRERSLQWPAMRIGSPRRNAALFAAYLRYPLPFRANALPVLYAMLHSILLTYIHLQGSVQPRPLKYVRFAFANPPQNFLFDNRPTAQLSP